MSLLHHTIQIYQQVDLGKPIRLKNIKSIMIMSSQNLLDQLISQERCNVFVKRSKNKVNHTTANSLGTMKSMKSYINHQYVMHISRIRHGRRFLELVLGCLLLLLMRYCRSSSQVLFPGLAKTLTPSSSPQSQMPSS